jgi:hypothetical protein
MRAPVWVCFVAALFVSAFVASLSTVQAAAPPASTDVTTCNFNALTTDDAGGPAVRDAPDAKGRVLGHLPPVPHPDWGTTIQNGVSTPTREYAQFEVTGFKDGWFRIKGANYAESSAPLYAGEGWIDAKFVTTGLYRDTLKAAPDNNAPDAAYLRGVDTDGISYGPNGVPVNHLSRCSGKWFEAEIYLPGAKLLSGKPAPNKNGAIRGWTDRSCTEQRNQCLPAQFDYAWSPLPAGVTECDMKTISADRDPKGLNVRASPDAHSAVLGQIPPPSGAADVGVDLAADVLVIGYKKGWFFVEAGPYGTDNPPPKGFKPYTGRGWVAANMLTAELLRDWLKQKPDEKSANVVNLTFDQGDPQTVKMRHIFSCSGDWEHVELAVVKNMKPLMKTDAPAGAVRGWSNGTCTNQLTTCDFSGDTPWSAPAPVPPE